MKYYFAGLVPQLINEPASHDWLRLGLGSRIVVVQHHRRHIQTYSQRTKMEEAAKAYDELSKPQVEAGEEFIRELNLSKGDKVLDMGCGTGTLTKFIADIVGPDGEAVGVDPDAKRIEIAVDKYKASSNVHFHVSDSVAGFPHDDQPYYDAHVSIFTFHWVPNEQRQKEIYIEKAYRCLKSGGKLAIWCGVKPKEALSDDVKPKNVNHLHPLTQNEYRELFQAVGLFNNVAVDIIVVPFRFQSFEDFKRWYETSLKVKLEDINPMFYEKFLVKGDDGRITWSVPMIRITASKD